MVVIEVLDAKRNRVTEVPVGDAVEFKWRESGVADDAHLIKRLMGKAMVSHSSVICHRCRGCDSTRNLNLGRFRGRRSQVKDAIEVATYFHDESSGLIIEQQCGGALLATCQKREVIFIENELLMQLRQIV